jgi:Na+/melibiose symporter-like transporter
MKFSFRHVFNVTVVVLLAIYVVTAWGYNPQARLMPLVVSVPILILSIVQTISDFRKREEPARAKATTKEKEVTEKKKFKKEVNAFLWAIGLFLGFYLFGFIITTAFFTFLSLKVRSRFGWRPSLGVSVGCLAFLYIVLVYGFNLDLYPGSLVLLARKTLYGY